MSSSGEEDDPQDQTKEQSQLITSGLKTLLDKVGEDDDENQTRKNIKESGSQTLKLLEKMVHRIYHFNSGIIAFEEIEDAVQDFVFHYQVFSHEAGTHKEDRKVIMDILLTLANLGKNLRNLNKGRECRIPPQHSHEEKESTSIEDVENTDVDVENNKQEVASERNNQEDVVESVGTKQVNKEIDVIETPPKKKIRFVNVSPKADLMKTYECHICPKKYLWLKALRKHLKNQHDGAEVVGNNKEVEDRVTCRICSVKQSRDLIGRHLKDVHKYKKVNPRAAFRGFITMDGESWQPLFLQKYEEDPPTEFLAPVDEDGSVNVYGMRFVVELVADKIEHLVEEVEDLVEGVGQVKDVIEEAVQNREEAVDVIKDKSKECIEVELMVTESNKEGDAVIPLQHSYQEKESTSVEAEEDRDVDAENNKQEVATERDNQEDVVERVDRDDTEEESTQVELMFTESNEEGDIVNDFCLLEDVEDLMCVNEEVDKESHPCKKRKSVVRNLFDEFDDENDEDDIRKEIKKPKKSVNEVEKTVKVQVFTEPVKNGDFWSVEENQEIDENDDTDCEDLDNEEYTKARREMKRLRYEERNVSVNQTKICELEENAIIIKEFEDFLRNLKFENPNNTGDLSTVRKNMGHLFFYPDSLLEFELTHYDAYNLMRHFTPMSDDFLQVTDPTMYDGWIHAIGGPDGKSNPGRRKEQLKTHARWRDFVAEKLTKTDFGSSAAELFKKESTINNLQSITTKIKKKGTFRALTKLDDEERNERLKAMEVMNPGVDFKELNAVRQWFDSDVSKEEEQTNLRNYEKCLTGRKLGEKEFLRFANWCRFSLALEDRNRRAVYNFTNREMSERRPKYLPKGKSDEEVSNYIFHKLPENWNPDISLSGEEPSCWVINVAPGTKGLKGRRAAQIVLTQRSAEICLKYRDLKVECMDTFEDNDPFFVNIKNKALTAMQRTPGSLLAKLGKVCGIENATVNTLRRAAEVRVQDSPVMKSSVEKLQSHSSQVGLRHYDRSDDTTRASFISQLSAMELPNQEKVEVPESVREKRDKIDKIERQKILEKAKEKLTQDRFGKKEQINKKCKLLPNERKFMQELFKDTGIESVETFPDDSSWKKVFYRGVDYPGWDELRKIESNIFRSTVKPQVVAESGPWLGTMEQNNNADLKVSMIVKTSFKVYEKSRKEFEPAYFKF